MKNKITYQTEEERQGLWQRLQQFCFDEPDAVITFRDKLAAKNNWTKAFTERVIEEYRRFVFLCCVSPCSASPSFYVDEVWHLHLTYTRSYWISLCHDTLKMDLHHNPSKGTKDDIKKHKAWYIETLSLYEQNFGEVPPANIWPRPIKQKEETKPVRVLPPVSSMVLFLFLAAMLLCFLFSLFYHFIFPFNLKGPEFLLFYALLWLVVALAYWQFLVREKNAVRAFVQSNMPTGVNAFQLAHFLYGPKRAIQTAVVDLVDKGQLSMKDNKTLVITTNWQLEESKNPLINSLWYEPEGTEINLETIASTCANDDGFFHPQIRKIQTQLKAHLFEETLPFLFILLGSLRMTQGLLFEKRVSDLAQCCLLFGMLFLIMRVLFSRKKIAQAAVKRQYIAETDSLDGESVDPVKRFAVRSEPSLSAFSGAVIGLGTAILFSQPGKAGGSEGGGSGGCSSGGGGGCGGGCGGCGGG
ncbi:MAG TPA: hypothetical protein VEY10_03810 [Flavisolibacter sp.]|nr:hypothetical protein [Flavisolibacter sp.]